MVLGISRYQIGFAIEVEVRRNHVRGPQAYPNRVDLGKHVRRLGGEFEVTPPEKPAYQQKKRQSADKSGLGKFIYS
jgi:hypothetical protein